MLQDDTGGSKSMSLKRPTKVGWASYKIKEI
jgi:hypothetical protein